LARCRRLPLLQLLASSSRAVVTTDQQIGADLLTETHPPTPSDLVAGIDHVEGMLSDTIKVCEHVKHPRMTLSPSSMPLGLRNTAHVASRYMKQDLDRIWTQDPISWKLQESPR
jgi:hypothetical protein